MTVRLNGTESEYRIQGNGDKKVVLLHGWGCDMSMMQPVADALCDEHSVLLLDFPGHGKSGNPPEPWGIPEYACWLENLLESLHFTPCAVIAHSFGCRVAAWLAADKPDIFTRMVFTGAAGIRPKPSEEARRRSRHYQRMKKCCLLLCRIPGLSHAGESLESRLRRKYGSPDYNALDDEMRKTFVKVVNHDLTAVYPAIRQSTLLIWGDEDTETPVWMGRKMEEMIPDAGLVILENGTHFAYLEQLQRFCTIVRHFLKGDE